MFLLSSYCRPGIVLNTVHLSHSLFLTILWVRYYPQWQMRGPEMLSNLSKNMQPGYKHRQSDSRAPTLKYFPICSSLTTRGLASFYILFVPGVMGSWGTEQVSKIRIIPGQQTLATHRCRWKVQMDSSQRVTIATHCEYQGWCSSCLINVTIWQILRSLLIFPENVITHQLFFIRGSFYDSYFE